MQVANIAMLRDKNEDVREVFVKGRSTDAILIQ